MDPFGYRQTDDDGLLGRLPRSTEISMNSTTTRRQRESTILVRRETTAANVLQASWRGYNARRVSEMQTSTAARRSLEARKATELQASVFFIVSFCFGQRRQHEAASEVPSSANSVI